MRRSIEYVTRLLRTLRDLHRTLRNCVSPALKKVGFYVPAAVYLRGEKAICQVKIWGCILPYRLHVTF